MSSVSPDPLTYEKVSVQLGRPAEGLREVIRWVKDEPVVVRVALFVEGNLFPTLFWLSHPEFVSAIGELESDGTMGEFQEQIDQSPELQQILHQDNLDFIKLRETYLDDADRIACEKLGENVLAKKGIGGNSNFTRIRCLHAHYAAHLKLPNRVGTMVDKHLESISHPILQLKKQLSDFV